MTTDIDSVCSTRGWTGIMYAIYEQNISSVKYFLDNGSIINCKSEYNNRPIDISVYNTTPEIINLLIDEYVKYIIRVKVILKYLGLDNIYVIVEIICESKLHNDILIRTVYN